MQRNKPALMEALNSKNDRDYTLEVECNICIAFAIAIECVAPVIAAIVARWI